MSEVDKQGNCSACGGVHYGTGNVCVYKQSFPEPKPKISEEQESRLIANRVLDKPYIDPDGDICMLARQLLRADECIARTEADLVAERERKAGEATVIFEDSAVERLVEALQTIEARCTKQLVALKLAENYMRHDDNNFYDQSEAYLAVAAAIAELE